MFQVNADSLYTLRLVHRDASAGRLLGPSKDRPEVKILCVVGLASGGKEIRGTVSQTISLFTLLKDGMQWGLT